jgi:peptidoglycan/xylan/chitin deacetylase (PgdA/CDA1 family)
MYDAVSDQAVEDASGLYPLGSRKFRELVDALSQWSSTRHFIPVQLGIYHLKDLDLTFDDGCADSFDAALAFAERGLSITIFVATSLLGSGTSFLEKQQVRQSALRQRIETGSHGHRHLPLTALSDSNLSKELLHSRSSLSRLCGKEIVSLSNPFGRQNRVVQDAVRRAAFRRATSSRHGIHRVTTDSYQIPHRDIWSDINLRILESRLSGSWNLLGWAGQ